MYKRKFRNIPPLGFLIISAKRALVDPRIMCRGFMAPLLAQVYAHMGAFVEIKENSGVLREIK